jgi:hypothetical protein
MPIYLLHVIFAAAFRTLLVHHWPHGSEIAYAVVLTFVGVVLPYAVFRCTELFGLDALFGFSGRARGAARLAPGMTAEAGVRS